MKNITKFIALIISITILVSTVTVTPCWAAGAVDVNMDFFIDKIEYMNGETWYVMKSAFLYYGLRKEDLPLKYTYEGAEIYAEQRGYMASWFENIYKEYSESPFPKDIFKYE